jgi:hypothetical protein
MDRLELFPNEVGATEERLDQLTRDLVQEIRQLDIDFVGLAEALPQDGAKGLANDIGHVLVQLSAPTSVLALMHVLREWLRRRQGRRITITHDDKKRTIEIIGPDDRQIQKFVESYMREQDSRQCSEPARPIDANEPGRDSPNTR